MNKSADSGKPPTLNQEDYHAGLERFQRIYDSECLSSRPRLEITIAAMTSTTALGACWSILIRLGSLGFDFAWLAFSVLVPLGYHLRTPAAMTVFPLDEFIFRLSWKLGYPEPWSLYDRSRPRAMVRKWFLELSCVAILLGLIMGSVQIIDGVFPLVQPGPYTGGG